MAKVDDYSLTQNDDSYLITQSIAAKPRVELPKLIKDYSFSNL